MEHRERERERERERGERVRERERERKPLAICTPDVISAKENLKKKEVTNIRTEPKGIPFHHTSISCSVPSARQAKQLFEILK